MIETLQKTVEQKDKKGAEKGVLVSLKEERIVTLQLTIQEKEKEVVNKELLIQSLKWSENMAQDMPKQQWDLTKSLLLNVRLEKKTKFIQGNRSLSTTRQLQLCY